jgi:DNA processing protein
LVQEWTDITNELPVPVRRDLVSTAQQRILWEAGKVPVPGEEKEAEEPQKALARKLLQHLQVDVPQQLDTLLESFEGVSSSELIGALFDLQMSGLVRQLPGRNFVKVW